MRTIKSFLVGVFLLGSVMLIAQVENDTTQKIRKNAISFNFFGPTPIIGITYERVLASKLSMEIGLGLPSIGLGVKFYPLGIKIDQPMFSVGITGTYFASQESEMTPRPSFVFYIPFGVTVFRKKGFNFNFDFGPGYGYDRFIPYGNLKFGVRF